MDPKGNHSDPSIPNFFIYLGPRGSLQEKKELGREGHRKKPSAIQVTGREERM